MTTIGDLTLAMIGTTRLRTEYEGATIEGRVTSLNLDVDTTAIRSHGLTIDRDVIDVRVDLTLGRIELHGLDRSHPCEVIA